MSHFSQNANLCGEAATKVVRKQPALKKVLCCVRLCSGKALLVYTGS